MSLGGVIIVWMEIYVLLQFDSVPTGVLSSSRLGDTFSLKSQRKERKRKENEERE